MEGMKRPAWRDSLRVFRERFGGLTEEKKDYQKRHRDAHQRIAAALGGGPATVPAVAAATGLPSAEVLWHMMAMKRYGELTEVGRADRYFLYALKGKER